MLTDGQIDTFAKPFAGMGGVEDYRAFARAVESAVRSQDDALLRQVREALQKGFAAMDAFTDEMTVGTRYSNEGQAALDALVALRESLAALDSRLGPTPAVPKA